MFNILNYYIFMMILSNVLGLKESKYVIKKVL